MAPDRVVLTASRNKSAGETVGGRPLACHMTDLSWFQQLKISTACVDFKSGVIKQNTNNYLHF